jgi:hypothetical protein
MKTAEALARNYLWPRVRIPVFNGYFSLFEYRLLVTRGDCSATDMRWELRGLHYMRWQERSYPGLSLCVYSAHFCSALTVTSFTPNNKWQEGFTFCFCNKGLLRVKSMEQFVFSYIILDSSSKAFHFIRPDQCHGTCILNYVPPYCKSDIYLYKHTHTYREFGKSLYARLQCIMIAHARLMN